MKRINFKNGGELVIFGRDCMMRNVPMKDHTTASSMEMNYEYIKDDINFSLVKESEEK